MRNRLLHLGWLAVSLAGCATAVDPGAATDTSHDAGTHDAASSFTSDAGSTTKDAAASVDSGSSQDAAQQPQQPDSGTTNTSCGSAYTGSLATFDFSNEPGNQTSTPATSVASGLTAGDLSRSSALTATSGTSSINSSNWTTSQTLDSTRYYTFTLTPPSGCSLDLSSLSITTAASKTGPADAVIATSDDGFSSTVPFTVGASDTPSVGVSGATNAVEVRLYGFGASSTAGTLRINSTLTVSGSVQ